MTTIDRNSIFNGKLYIGSKPSSVFDLLIDLTMSFLKIRNETIAIINKGVVVRTEQIAFSSDKSTFNILKLLDNLWRLAIFDCSQCTRVKCFRSYGEENAVMLFFLKHDFVLIQLTTFVHFNKLIDFTFFNLFIRLNLPAA